jgi:hypothetical protein
MDRVIKDEMTRYFIVIWSAGFCVEICCQETSNADGESYSVYNGEL